MKSNRKTVAVLVLVIATFLGVSAVTLFWALSSRGNISQDGSSNISIDKIKDPKKDAINVLCVGVDLSEKLTDVIIIARVDVKNNEVSMLQVPRDSFVGDDYPTGKMNAVYGNPEKGKTGIQQLEYELEKRLNITIDNYAMVDLDALRDIVDDIGGVKMDIKQQINYGPGMTLKPGEQVLDGEKAEWIVRYRKGYITGDIGRMDAQKQFLFAAFNTVKEKGKTEMLKLLVKNFNYVKTDMPLNTALEYASYMQKISTEQIKTYLIPGEGVMNYSFAVYEVDTDKLAVIINEIFKDEYTQNTAEDLDFPLAKRNPVQKPESSSDENADENSGDETDESSSETTDENNEDTEDGDKIEYDSGSESSKSSSSEPDNDEELITVESSSSSSIR